MLLSVNLHAEINKKIDIYVILSYFWGKLFNFKKFELKMEERSPIMYENRNESDNFYL